MPHTYSLTMLPPVITIITGMYVAAMGLYRVRGHIENILFPVLCTLWTLNSTSFFIQSFAGTPDQVFRIEQWTLFLFCYFPVAHIIFFHRLLGISNKPAAWASGIGGILLSISVFTDPFMKGVKEYPWGYLAQGGPLLFVFLVFCFIWVSYAAYILHRQITKETNPIIKIKYKFIQFGFLMSSGLAMLMVLPMRGVNLYPPGNFIFITLGLLGYGLLRYRILGVRAIIQKTLLLITSILIVSIPNFFVFILIEPTLDRIWPNLHFLILIIWFYVNFHFAHNLQPHLRRFFEKDSYDLTRVGISFFENILYLRTTGDLTNEFRNVVKKHLDFKDVNFFFPGENPEIFTDTHGERINLPVSVQAWLSSEKELIERHFLETTPHYHPMKQILAGLFESRNAQYMVSMVQHGKLIGLVFMTDNVPDRLLDKVEAQFINHVSGYLSVALYNSAVYQDMTTLKDELEEKTKKLSEEIKEREKAENVVQESRARYKLLAENIIDSIWVMSVETFKFKYLSPSISKLLGYTVKELASLELKDILTRESFEFVEKTRLNLLMHKRFKTTDSLTLELEHVRKDGTQVWVEVMSHILHDDKGGLDLIGVSRDITERKRSEKEKKNLEFKLMHAQKMESIGALAGGIAHDFNNILMAILGYAHLAKVYVPESNTPAHEKLSRIEKSCQRAKDMVAQILVFSRQSEQNKMPIQVVPIVNDALGVLKETLPHGVNIIRDFNDNLRSVLADPVQIHQVVTNLCSNAVHAMEAKGGICMISLTEARLNTHEAQALSMKPGYYICLSVSDTGIGMDAKTKERIFDPYFSTKEFGKGSGMGLAVVHGIVTGSGGKIVVESEVGTGTRFDVYLPCTESFMKEAEPSGSLTTGAERILFVDDDEDIVELTHELLSGLGYEVIGMTDCKKALAMFHDNPSSFDLVITDLIMPDISGEHFAEEVHKIRPDMPMILCTGYNTYIVDQKSKKHGFKDILIKPIPSGDLAEAVRSVLDSIKEGGERG